jgi:hypothetical protein
MTADGATECGTECFTSRLGAYQYAPRNMVIAHPQHTNSAYGGYYKESFHG